MNVLCLFVLCTLVCAATFVGATELSLDSICAGHQVKITTKSQIHSLAEQLKSNGGNECNTHTQRALAKFDDLVNSEDPICSVKHVKQIRKFFNRFVTPPEQSRWTTQPTMPIALRRAAVLYGLKVTNICKTNMVRLLPKASQQLLGPDDFAMVARFTNDKFVNTLLSDPDEYTKILIPVLFDEALADLEKNGGKIYVQSPAVTASTSKLQQVCAARFQPIYEPLMLPAIMLSNLGLNYNGDQLEAELQKKGDVETIHLWYRIVFMCEAIRPIVPIKSKEDKFLRILTRDEAIGKTIEFDSSVKLETIKYNPELNNKIEDEFVDASNNDAKLMKFVDNFKQYKRHINHLMFRVSARFVKLVLVEVAKIGWRWVSSLFKKKELDIEELKIIHEADIKADNLEENAKNDVVKQGNKEEEKVYRVMKEDFDDDKLVELLDELSREQVQPKKSSYERIRYLIKKTSEIALFTLVVLAIIFCIGGTLALGITHG